LRTADANSPVIGPAIAVTFALFVLVYAIIFSAGIYFINRLIAKGIQDGDVGEPAVSLGGTLAAAGKSSGGGE
jgi:cytochrome d ubiquinol oxidase subunit I